MHARATTLRGSTDAVDQAIEQYRSTLATFRGIPGNAGGLLLVDRSTASGIAVTLWENEQAMIDSRGQAERLRQQAAGSVGGTVESVVEYEVAVWDVT